VEENVLILFKRDSGLSSMTWSDFHDLWVFLAGPSNSLWKKSQGNSIDMYVYCKTQQRKQAGHSSLESGPVGSLVSLVLIFFSIFFPTPDMEHVEALDKQLEVLYGAFKDYRSENRKQ
jgi:hypothetical protein